MVDKPSNLPSDIYGLAGMLPPEDSSEFLQLCYTLYGMAAREALQELVQKYVDYVDQLTMLRTVKSGDLLVLSLSSGRQVLAKVEHRNRDHTVKVAAGSSKVQGQPGYGGIIADEWPQWSYTLIPDLKFDKHSDYSYNTFFDSRHRASKARPATKAEQVLYKVGDEF